VVFKPSHLFYRTTKVLNSNYKTVSFHEIVYGLVKKLMKRKFITNLALVIFLNLLVKPFWIFGIDRTVQNVVGAESYGLYFSLLFITAEAAEHASLNPFLFLPLIESFN